MTEVFNIKQDKPHIGEMIRALREHRDVSQDYVAKAVFENRSKISQIECGNKDCEDDLLLGIKTVLDMEILPLTEAERPEFIEALYKWYNIISDRDWETADKLRTQLSLIKLLPHDKESNLLFSLFDCRFLLVINELDEAKKILDELDAMSDELSDAQLYHYNYNQGTYNTRLRQNQTALDYYLKAFELTKRGFEKNTSLYYNIAVCYERLGNVALAITYLEAACELYPTTQNNVSEFSLYNCLGINYAHIGLLQKAKETLDKAHAIALSKSETASSDNKIRMLSQVFINYGYTYRMAKKWNMAIEYLDKALDILDKKGDFYLEAFYQKIRIFIERGNTLSCINLLAEGVQLSKGSEMYSTGFEILQIMINLNDDTARDLETRILPYLLKNNFIYPALDCAMVLRDYLKSKGSGSKIRALEMSEIIFTIHNMMMEGGVIE